MPRHESETSSLDDLPVYFRPFTRESVKAIRQHMAEEEIKQKELKAKKAEEVSLTKLFCLYKLSSFF